MFQLNLTPEQMQVLAGLLDAAIKTVGVRAMEDDVVDLFRAIKVDLFRAIKSATPPASPEEPEG
jgi:hypothetical protein